MAAETGLRSLGYLTDQGGGFACLPGAEAHCFQKLLGQARAGMGASLGTGSQMSRGTQSLRKSRGWRAGGLGFRILPQTRRGVSVTVAGRGSRTSLLGCFQNEGQGWKWKDLGLDPGEVKLVQEEAQK